MLGLHEGFGSRGAIPVGPGSALIEALSTGLDRVVRFFLGFVHGDDRDLDVIFRPLCVVFSTLALTKQPDCHRRWRSCRSNCFQRALWVCCGVEVGVTVGFTEPFAV